MCSLQTVSKSSVSALQEYCGKNQIPWPTYEWIEGEKGSFVCEVEILGVMSQGNGRSKRDAKHQAAANAIKKLRLSHPDIGELPPAHIDDTPITDMIVLLRDYCVRNNHPLPTFDIVQQAGSPDAPEFTALCVIASIKRYAVSDNKKDARQKAALDMYRTINNSDLPYSDKSVATLEAKTKDVNEERYLKFKTYRELTESKTSEIPGVLLCDRHNHFTKYFEPLKSAARTILSTPYESTKEQALDVLQALKLKPRTTELAVNNSLEKMIFIEFDCDYDVVFAGLPNKVYAEVLQYFREML